jgi:hypothetical protein
MIAIPRFAPLLLMLGCHEPSVVGSTNDSGAADAATPDSGGRDAGAPSDAGMPVDCVEEARLIYLTTRDALTDTGPSKLVRFDPEARTFDEVGPIDCGVSGVPFSMAIDRTGTAWTLFDNGLLYRISVRDASCEPTPYVGGQIGTGPGSDVEQPNNFTLFSMAFTADPGTRTGERLFVILHDTSIGEEDKRRFMAWLDLESFRIRRIASIVPSQAYFSLSGNAAGELWAFGLGDRFHGGTWTTTVRRLDHDANTHSIYQLSSVSDFPSGGDFATAWWGGRLFVFVRPVPHPATEIVTLTRDGMVERYMQESGRIISTAAVSTCAPLI